MINRYRVLSAMLALDEFTPEQLAEYSGVNLSTVRAVLARESALWEEVGRRDTGRRGGRPRIRRLVDGAADRIRADLDALHDALPAPAAPVGASTGEYPLALLAADAALRHTFAAARTARERDDALALARTSLEAAGRVFAAAGHDGARETDRRSRQWFDRLATVLGRIEAGEATALEVPSLVGPSLVEDAVPVPDPGAIVLVSCEGSANAERDLAMEGHERLQDLGERIRHAADLAGLRVEERGTGVATAVEAGPNPVILIHDSSHRPQPGHAFWRVLERAGERLCVMDIGANDELRNTVMARMSLYLDHAEMLDEPALTGAIHRMSAMAGGAQPLPVAAAEAGARPPAAAALAV